MDCLKLESEWAEVCSKLEKKFRDRRTFDRLAEQVYRGQKAKLSWAIRRFRTKLERFYETQGIRPRLGFVPINDQETGLFIQAYTDIQTGKLVVGDPQDLADWIEAVVVRTKPMADLFQDATRAAKAFLALKGVNPDLRGRMEAIAEGKTPQGLPWAKGS